MTTFLVGSTVLPAIPICMEFGAELTFPVSIANSSGALYMAGQFHSFSITMAVQAVTSSLNEEGESTLGTTIGIWVGVGLALIAVALGIWVRRKFILTL